MREGSIIYPGDYNILYLHSYHLVQRRIVRVLNWLRHCVITANNFNYCNNLSHWLDDDIGQYSLGTLHWLVNQGRMAAAVMVAAVLVSFDLLKPVASITHRNRPPQKYLPGSSGAYVSNTTIRPWRNLTQLKEAGLCVNTHQAIPTNRGLCVNTHLAIPQHYLMMKWNQEPREPGPFCSQTDFPNESFFKQLSFALWKII